MIAALRFVVRILKFVAGFLTGTGYQPGDSLGSVAKRLPTITNKRVEDKAKALTVENKIMREAAETDRGERREEIRDEVTVEDEKGRVVGLNLSRRSGR